MNEDIKKEFDEVWTWIDSQIDRIREDSWCHKFTQEGIVVKPSCRHNLRQDTETRVDDNLKSKSGGKE